MRYTKRSLICFANLHCLTCLLFFFADHLPCHLSQYHSSCNDGAIPKCLATSCLNCCVTHLLYGEPPNHSIEANGRAGRQGGCHHTSPLQLSLSLAVLWPTAEAASERQFHCLQRILAPTSKFRVVAWCSLQVMVAIFFSPIEAFIRRWLVIRYGPCSSRMGWI